MIAHITNHNGTIKTQYLKEHCIETGIVAGKSLKSIGLYNTAYLSGLLHDMGKGTEAFDNYINDSFKGKKVKRGSINHTFAGVIYILEKYHNSRDPMDLLTSEIIAYSIGAHHGLFDCNTFDGENGFEYRLQKDKSDIYYQEAKDFFLKNIASEREIENLFLKSKNEINNIYSKIPKDKKNRSKTIHVLFQVGLLNRLILSSVMYGDHVNTASFFNQVEYCEPKVDWGRELECFESKILKFDNNRPLNKLRQNISEQCYGYSKRSEGIYRLNVPTGGGKTLSSLRYALSHAKEFNKDRIIFIIPMLSILDQNARVIKEFVSSSDLVIEHHSNVLNDIHENDIQEIDTKFDKWDGKIIISTMVQFMNILYGGKSSSIARMQALTNSVIVIDEIQMLPKKTISMFNAAMNFLKNCCNSTIILSSATQPCLEKVPIEIELSDNPDIVKLTDEQLQLFKRCNIIDCTDEYGKSHEDILEMADDILSQSNSLLMVCNTKKDAYIFYERFVSKYSADSYLVYHLSTSMCKEHRTEVLEAIMNDLDKIQRKIHDKKIVCISTQLVEAGVDFSFQSVIRIMAGLDNLAQSAGRCNRGNEYDTFGNVYFVKLKKENLSRLQEIQVAKDCSLKTIQEVRTKGSLIDDEHIKYYYRSLFYELRNDLNYPIENGKKSMIDCLTRLEPSTEARKYYLSQPFKYIGDTFNLFDTNTSEVIVPYKEGKKVIEKLKEKELYGDYYDIDATLKKAKQYTIDVFEYQLNKLREQGLVETLFDGRIIVLDEQCYDTHCGLLIEEKKAADYIL